MRLLVFNPGSNSLKFQIVDTADDQRTANGGTSRLTAAIENLANRPHFPKSAKGRPSKSIR